MNKLERKIRKSLEVAGFCVGKGEWNIIFAINLSKCYFSWGKTAVCVNLNQKKTAAAISAPWMWLLSIVLPDTSYFFHMTIPFEYVSKHNNCNTFLTFAFFFLWLLINPKSYPNFKEE